MSSFLRRIEILAFLKRHRRALTAPEIVEHLQEGGYLDPSLKSASALRVVQRDLKELLGADTGDEEDTEPDNPFGLRLERQGSRTLLWSVDRQLAPPLDFERMPQPIAMAMVLLRKHLSLFLPAPVRADLESLFDQAEERLMRSERKLSARHHRRWRDAVAFFQRGQTLRMPEFPADVLDAIYQAIVTEKQVELHYSSGKTYRVTPLGVACLLPKLYLIARNENSEMRHFLLSRIRHCEVISRSALPSGDFVLTDYLEQGGMELRLAGVPEGAGKVLIRIRDGENSRGLRQDLAEFPVAPDQQLLQASDGDWRLSFSSHCTVQLRSWILGLGPVAVVEQPTALRENIREHLQIMAASYCG